MVWKSTPSQVQCNKSLRRFTNAIKVQMAAAVYASWWLARTLLTSHAGPPYYADLVNLAERLQRENMKGDCEKVIKTLFVFMILNSLMSSTLQASKLLCVSD